MEASATWPRRWTITALIVALGVLATVMTPVNAQTTGPIPEADIDDLVDYTVHSGIPFADDEPWIDPVEIAGLDASTIVPAPEFDPLDFHNSTVLATGVDLVSTDDDRLDELAARHVRVLQTIATLDRDIDELAGEIDDLRPRADRLVEQIAHERENETRLVEEIDVLERAVAEYAVRTFIFQEDLETAFSEPALEVGENRVVSDAVRTDHFEQLDQRRTELTDRMAQRRSYQDDLVLVRRELESLRTVRLEALGQRRDIATLTDRTEATYAVELHTRLVKFVEGTDVPLVALNAYVIASRTLGEEQPQCGITWSMLAGIGRIESFHGHFADSTLDINGNTTEDIYGLPLDGRILEGAEFVGPDGEAPDPTTRTEVLPVPQTPGPGEPPTEATPRDAPATEPAAPTDPAAAPDSVEPAETATDSDGSEEDALAAPPPVIRRLALIEDSDDGALDGDTTFDRAVGPMQFIPSTWRLFAQDGNLDGEPDPQNIYDASLASARYLCASTPTMTTVDGELRAYFAYNHDEEYSRNVHETGLRYGDLIDVREPEDPAAEAIEDITDLGTFTLGIADPERFQRLVSRANSYVASLTWTPGASPQSKRDPTRS